LGYKTKFFQDNEAIDAYVNDLSYSGRERLCFGVVMEKNNVNNEYEYHLKFNASMYDGRTKDIPGTEFFTRVNTLAK
jgi:hypothetical protein